MLYLLTANFKCISDKQAVYLANRASTLRHCWLKSYMFMDILYFYDSNVHKIHAVHVNTKPAVLRPYWHSKGNCIFLSPTEIFFQA